MYLGFISDMWNKTYDDNGKSNNRRPDLASKIANFVNVLGQDKLVEVQRQ